ncbi:hypothetical protein GJ700_32615 [Duganella sp. FT92W]|uniref:Pesticin C-terminal domain-containing protein n=1 Tax=Pseudoduganella rivuli TaxID=2666085 RepID=A0A7X2IUP7_9BURK|nr:pesticin C-terminus-like muramidase [Pseudoduganella rivuli]MRV76465.1 hypothetical protein [Pseudoduganella rivuli]
MHLESELATAVLPVILHSGHSEGRTIDIQPENPDPPASPDVVYWPEELESGNFGFSLGGGAPSTGFTTVIIVGKKLPPYSNWTYWNGEGAPFTYNNYVVLTGGGGGGVSSSVNHCSNGSQQVDWNFINQHEGERLNGYVPKDNNGVPLGHSGTTISFGFDLGQHNYDDLGKLGLSSSLATKLSPYLGLKGSNAVNFLSSHPLSISHEESAAISAAAHSETLARLVTSYDNTLNKPGAFYGLPARTQTAIADVAFQYENLAAATPVFWSKITAQDWPGAINELQNFHDAYPTRRNDEANLIESDRVESRLLPNNICH